MFFSRMTLQANADKNKAFWQTFKNPYTLHQSIWQLFADNPERDRDFIYRLDQERDRPLVYAVSAREPLDGQDLWQIESKVYRPKLFSGMRLSFMLRANPVRTKRDEAGKQHRHDVVMEAKTRLKAEKTERASEICTATLVQETGSQWLETRAERYGFNLNPDVLRADGYQQHRFFKDRGKSRISISTLDFSGVLSISDPKHFIETLYKGIGPAKAFGCGMLMVKRI